MSNDNHTDTGASQPSSEVQQLRARVAYLEARLMKRRDEIRELIAERDRFQRLFATACETLGAVQEALGNENTPELTGFEPELVRKLRGERDALVREIEGQQDKEPRS
ncbi:hypothetical protein HNO53_20605 [Billgrantia antri]|uniref:Uncharacterized protein n=1 Tax=Halomonas sulfidivorans TaxID=2733488 RepID=A0ABX7WLU4_9GAMM|nr:hypothetical protein [Halomonas sulfidivorans]QTP60901.1 hypothetical protein HNO53_20605 [Halomonas sulfidivorans]